MGIVSFSARVCVYDFLNILICFASGVLYEEQNHDIETANKSFENKTKITN